MPVPTLDPVFSVLSVPLKLPSALVMGQAEAYGRVSSSLHCTSPTKGLVPDGLWGCHVPQVLLLLLLCAGPPLRHL